MVNWRDSIFCECFNLNGAVCGLSFSFGVFVLGGKGQTVGTPAGTV